MKLNITEIQNFYDMGNSWSKTIKKFNTSYATIFKYIKKGLLITRNKSESLKLHYSNNPAPIVSTETKKKISNSMKDFFRNNPDKVPYLLNHTTKGDSFPEKYFQEIINKHNLDYIKKYRYFTYQLDFADINKGINLEIDGDQHYLDKTILAHDLKRNQFLIEKGWKIIRVKWSSFQKLNKDDKETVINSIINNTVLEIGDVINFIGFDSPPEKSVVLELDERTKCECGFKKYRYSKKCKKCAITDKLKIKVDLNILKVEIKHIPLTQLAKKYNCSDNGLKKYCIRNNIVNGHIGGSCNPTIPD